MGVPIERILTLAMSDQKYVVKTKPMRPLTHEARHIVHPSNVDQKLGAIFLARKFDTFRAIDTLIVERNPSATAHALKRTSLPVTAP